MTTGYGGRRRHVLAGVRPPDTSGHEPDPEPASGSFHAERDSQMRLAGADGAGDHHVFGKSARFRFLQEALYSIP